MSSITKPQKKRPSNESDVQNELSKLSTKESDSKLTPKKQQKLMTSIQKLRVGEHNNDILLKIITTDIRQLPFGPLYTVYATDGTEFIQVEASGSSALQKLTQAIKLSDKGKFCKLVHVSTKSLKPEYNFGSVPFGIKIREETKITVTMECPNDAALLAYDEQEGFFAHLKGRFCFNPQEAQGALSNLGALQEGVINMFMQYKIENVSPMFTYQKTNVDARGQVFHADISSADGQKLKFSAWNMEAEFVNKLFENATGHQFICKNIRYRMDNQYGPQLTFGRQTKIALLMTMPKELDNVPDSLYALVTNSLKGYQKMNIKLQLLDGPGTYTKTTKVVVARDDHHKCQFFFPSELMFEKGHEVKLLGATIETLPSGVFNLHCNSSDIVTMPQAAVNPELVPDKYDFDYPSDDAALP